MADDNSHSQLEAFALALKRNYIRSKTWRPITTELRKQIRFNRVYAGRQARSYRKWVRLSYKKLRAHRRTQRCLSHLKKHNEWLRERLIEVRRERDRKAADLRFSRSQILENLRRRADAEFKKRQQIEERNKVQLRELTEELERDLCGTLDEISRLQTELEEAKRAGAEKLKKISEDSRSLLDAIERNKTFEVKQRLQEVHDLHAPCRAHQARVVQRVQEALQRLKNIQENRHGAGNQRQPEVRSFHQDDTVDIEDSDEEYI